jgi:hypothetical protein
MQGAGSPLRNHFSLGQVFRMNTQRDVWGGTMLIENGLRPGPGRECPPSDGSAKCPALQTDWPGRSLPPVTATSQEARRKLLEARFDELEQQALKEPAFKMKSSKAEFVARYLE